MITHNPFVMSADGGRTSFADYLQADFRPGVDVSRALQLYRNQVRFLDRQFGGFLQTLKRSGAWPRSIILVTADHGACWRPGCMPRYGRLTAVEPSLARIPMMIRAPLLKPRIVDNDYQHVDLYPTLLQVLGVMAGESGVRDGRDALDSPLRTRRRSFFPNGTDRSVELGIPPRRVEVANP